jgi:ABC-type phosphate transport system substrate-binding protein
MIMKRIIAYAVLAPLALSLALSLAACAWGGSTAAPPPTASGNGSVTPPPSIVDSSVGIPEMSPPMPWPEYPVIDGSSSTEVMDMAIRAYLTDAHLPIRHSQTYAALERLIPGHGDPADVILAVKYYDDTLEDAKARGADLVITPIAKEGFIFVLHKDNPVDSLTQQQLRGIYSGKITNWKELGGKNERIIPFTRNWDSGSHTAMEGFMGGVPIVGENDNIFNSMMIMLTQVEATGSPGIGYNIYSWSMNQNLGAMGLKAVAVDGIKPEARTLADSSYPLMVHTYSYYNKGNEKGKALTDWLLTAEGQGVITSAGYVGIFGDLPTGESPDYYKDERDSVACIETFYAEEGLLDWNSVSLYAELILDRAQTEALSDGKGKAVTVLYLAHFTEYDRSREVTRFIVLARDRGGTFEVINEGLYEYAPYKTVTFPASDRGRTEFNTQIYDVEPFDVRIQLPSGWSFGEKGAGAEPGGLFPLISVWSVKDIFDEDDEIIGVMGFNTYEEYEGAEDDPRAIYGQIALGNGYHFDVRESYTVVREAEAGKTATADVYYSASINNGKEKTNRGIVSYDKDRLVYIAIEFDYDMVTAEQLESIARSIEFARHEER